MGKRNNSQRKENVESPRKEISENEACNMTEKEFRVMVMEFIHRMDEKINNLCKNQEEMKSDIATIKNTMESFNSRLQEAEDRISELEDQVQKQAQAEQQLEKKIKKQEESLRELRDNMKRSNMRIIGLPEGQEEQQGLENLFEEIMTENFPDMGKIKVTQLINESESPQPTSGTIRKNIRTGGGEKKKLKVLRKYDSNYLKFGFVQEPGSELDPRPLCVVRSESLSNDAMKPSKLERHLQSKHPDLAKKKKPTRICSKDA
ncbi:hypothetical protein QTO34_014313 [Cnephaeus nilssonii]|uniref:Uncharacterized protein n=1 Tax=Cnephaeus nilssonii TaxID=3371016 RepID=A0AA40I745_CNENI|nr:hypothetical protein QTO34_014313 [Eptesicus nilssonii]